MRTQFTTVGPVGIRQDSLPYRLFQKAKKFGIWDPKDIDFSQDAVDWKTLTEEQRQETLVTISQFQAGEEAVTLDILPLILVIAKEGRLEEEMFLTTFLFEEAKHTEFFRLFLNAIGVTEDISSYHSPNYRKVFYEILPEAMDRLLYDSSPEAQASASTVYNMFVEGVLAESGYHALYNGLGKLGKMPGLMKGIGYLKKDESRHIGYGTYLLQRLICEHPSVYEVILNKLDELMPIGINLNRRDDSDREVNSYGVRLEEMRAFTAKQFSVRMDVLSRAKGKTIEQVYKTTETELGVQD